MSCGGCGGIRTAMNFAGAVVRAGGALLRGDEVTIPARERDDRLQICVKCPQFIGADARLGPRCSDCGCFLEVKTWLATEDCPQGRWDRTGLPIS